MPKATNINRYSATTGKPVEQVDMFTRLVDGSVVLDVLGTQAPHQRVYRMTTAAFETLAGVLRDSTAVAALRTALAVVRTGNIFPAQLYSSLNHLTDDQLEDLSKALHIVRMVVDDTKARRSSSKGGRI